MTGLPWLLLQFGACAAVIALAGIQLSRYGESIGLDAPVLLAPCRDGVLLADVSPVHAVTAGSAVIMTGPATVGLFFPPRSRGLGAVGRVSLGLATMYLLDTFLL